MPIPATTANAALSIVSGLVRLTGRVDRIMAEQTALREDLALPGKVFVKAAASGPHGAGPEGFSMTRRPLKNPIP